MKPSKASLLLLLIALAVTSQAQSNKRHVRILFIGNSAIYFHNLPQIITGIANSGPNPIEIESELISEGGQTLEGHWREGNAQREIRSKPWDYVVLQEQSNLNDEMRINGTWLITGWESYHRFAKLFDSEAKAIGAKTVLLSLWSHKGTPAREQQALDYASSSLGKEIGAIVVPAGTVWRTVEREDPTLNLYWDDFHPLPIASYMFATTFYSAVFKRNPAALTTKVVGRDINIEDKLGDDPNTVIVDVPAKTASKIKEIAYAIASRPLPRAVEPTEVKLPTLPNGTSLTNELLIGEWEGAEALFTKSPIPFALTIAGTQTGIKATAHLEMKQPIDDVDMVGNLTQNVATFENPKGVDGTQVRYRVVLVGTEVVGTTEVWQDKQLVAIASWKAKRKGHN